eukprot:scaffold9668_cov119-Skeletonema_dohrnii-CCMP3373.AAC.4
MYGRISIVSSILHWWSYSLTCRNALSYSLSNTSSILYGKEEKEKSILPVATPIRTLNTDIANLFHFKYILAYEYESTWPIFCIPDTDTRYALPVELPT